MIQLLAYKEIRFNSRVGLRKILKTDDYAQTENLTDFDLNYPDECRKKSSTFPSALETKVNQEFLPEQIRSKMP